MLIESKCKCKALNLMMFIVVMMSWPWCCGSKASKASESSLSVFALGEMFGDDVLQSAFCLGWQIASLYSQKSVELDATIPTHLVNAWLLVRDFCSFMAVHLIQPCQHARPIQRCAGKRFAPRPSGQWQMIHLVVNCYVDSYFLATELCSDLLLWLKAPARFPSAAVWWPVNPVSLALVWSLVLHVPLLNGTLPKTSANHQFLGSMFKGFGGVIFLNH